MGKFIDITGQKFGRLTVISYEGNRRWKVRCDCGREKVLDGYELRSGIVQSCGCLQKEKAIENGKNRWLDWSGRRFGRLTVLYRVENRGHAVRYMCRCDCGTEKIFSTSSLLSGAQSCGCYRNERRHDKLDDLTGQRFGKLTVLRRAVVEGNKTIWCCKCDCGNEVNVSATNLKRGRTHSCGCYKKEQSKLRHLTHGCSKNNRLYRIWICMRQRCFYEKNDNFNYYGGRGIIVCDEWKNAFEPFQQWALANGYADNLSIDRIDVNGNYEPANCRWVTMAVQNKNQRRYRNGNQ